MTPATGWCVLGMASPTVRLNKSLRTTQRSTLPRKASPGSTSRPRFRCFQRRGNEMNNGEEAKPRTRMSHGEAQLFYNFVEAKYTSSGLTYGKFAELATETLKFPINKEQVKHACAERNIPSNVEPPAQLSFVKEGSPLRVQLDRIESKIDKLLEMWRSQ